MSAADEQVGLMRLDFGLLLAASEPWSRRQRLNHHSPPLSRLGCRLRGGDQVSVAMLARHDYLHDTAAFALVNGFIDAIGEDHRHNAFQTRKSSAPKTYCCNSRPSIAVAGTHLKVENCFGT